jgi:uncharacterized protein YebE (UPF0316 family)
MEMKLLILFIVMNIINVVIQTVKSIATIKCGKTAAAIVNAVAYGLYTYIVVLTMCDLPLLAKCLIVAGANFIGVYVVKLIEEKARKDKLWKVEATIQNLIYFTDYIKTECEKHKIPYSVLNVENVDYVVFNFYCATQEKSRIVKQICDGCNAKYFVSESKTL